MKRTGFLAHLRIAHKLTLILALGIVGVTAVVATALFAERKMMLEDRIASTQHLVETAHSIAVMYKEKSTSGALTDDAARTAAADAIKALRYGETNYFWINDMQPRMVMHPIKPEMIGKDLSDYADPNGVKIFLESVARVKESGGGVIDYAWPKPGATDPVHKISYVKGFAPWGWVIGSGIYVDDVDAALRTHAMKLGGVGLCVIVLMALLSRLFAGSITAPLNRAVQLAKDIADGDLDTAVDAPASNSETDQLIRALGAMQARLKTQIGDMQAVLTENQFIRDSLDNIDTMIRIADRDGRVVFANRSLIKLLRSVEEDVRKFRPDFSADHFIGGNIGDIYPDGQAAVLRMQAITSTQRVRAPSYNRIIDFVYSPIFGPDGNQLGTVAEWVDATAQVNVENQLIDLLEHAGAGDFSRRISLEDKQGLLLSLSKGFNQLLGVVETSLSEVGRVLGALSHGDLRETIQGDFHGMLATLRDDTNATVRELAAIIAQIKSTTENINVAAREIATGNSDLAQRTEQQASSLDQTSTSMDTLTVTVRQNAESARQANELALSATGVAERGGQVVTQVVQTMDTISQSSRKIVDIISVIDGIAFQTNILALNAAVEAARAGEQGRGFAVVASEVRNLAQRSANAAKEIKTLIGDSVEKIGVGSKLVRTAGDTMGDVVTSIKRVSGIMGEISHASQEQSSGIDRVNTAVSQMDESTQQNAALVEEASAAAHSLTDQAEALSGIVSKFKLADAPVVRHAKLTVAA